MNERIEQLAEQAGMHRDKFGMYFAGDKHDEDGVDLEKFAELILANHAELTRSTDPINKPFELNPKFVAKCDEIGRSRRQFQ